MKIQTLVVALACCLATAAPGLASNPSMGTWKLNQAKSEFAPGMGKNMRVVFTPLPGHRVKTVIDSVDRNGRPIHTVWIGKRDGKPYPVQGNKTYDTLAYTQIDRYTSEIVAMKDGRVALTGRVVIKEDQAAGTRRVTTTGTYANGKKYTSVAVYNRQ